MSDIVDKVMFSSETGEWYTPLPLYKRVDSAFHFICDPCAEPTNHRLGCKYLFTKKDNGLEQEWPEGNVFLNPPDGRHSNMYGGIEKAASHTIVNKKGIAVVLVPARTDTTWFHHYLGF